MLDQFNRQELDAVVRLINDSDFKILIDYIKNSVTGLALASVKYSGEQGDKLKGACEGLQELRDLFLFSPRVQERLKQNEEIEARESRDTISP